MTTLNLGNPALTSKLDRGLFVLFERIITRFSTLDGVLAGWQYGSVARGLCDRHSDVDPVFLVEERFHQSVDTQLEDLIAPLCDHVVMIWPQDYNSKEFKNFGMLLKFQDRLYQFDLFCISLPHRDFRFCREHCEGLGSQNLFFDHTGTAREWLDRPLGGQDNPVPQPFNPQDRRFRESLLRHSANYLFHLNMCIKYWKRQDVLKFQNIMQRLYQEHASMLLSTIPPLGWGSMAAQVHHGLPQAEGCVLDRYFQWATLDQAMDALKEQSALVRQLVRDACCQREEPFPVLAWNEVSSALHEALSTH